MAGLAPVELSADCDQCGLEAGVVEVYDALVPACRFGLPATVRCKLCAASSEGALDWSPSKPLREIPANRCPACLDELGPAAIDERACTSCGARASLRETAARTAFATPADLERALDAWAEREKFASRDALAQATFIEPDVHKLFASLQRGDRIEILADPFANMGVRTTGSAGAAPRQPPATTRVATAAHPAAPQSIITTNPTSTVIRPVTPSGPPRSRGPTRPDPYTETAPLAAPITMPATKTTTAITAASMPPPSAPPRAIVYPLVSVIAADGEIHPEERALIDRFLESEGLPKLAEHEFCVDHPSEVAHFVPKERREDVVKLMCESASVDGMPDESERRVIRAYATAWGVDDEKLEFWMWGYESMNTSLARGLWLKLRRFVLSARWSEDEAARDL